MQGNTNRRKPCFAVPWRRLFVHLQNNAKVAVSNNPPLMGACAFPSGADAAMAVVVCRDVLHGDRGFGMHSGFEWRRSGGREAGRVRGVDSFDGCRCVSLSNRCMVRDGAY